MSFKNGSGYDIDMRKYNGSSENSSWKKNFNIQTTAELSENAKKNTYVKTDEFKKTKAKQLKRNNFSAKWRYHTPYGAFEKMQDAEEACGCHATTVRHRCKYQTKAGWWLEEISQKLANNA